MTLDLLPACPQLMALTVMDVYGKLYLIDIHATEASWAELLAYSLRVIRVMAAR